MDMNKLDSFLHAEGFCDFRKVATRHSIADIFPINKRCGIYVLRYTDGMYYVGQSVDVAKRFLQHKKKCGDIEQIAFKKVSKNNLDLEEKKYIASLENLVSIRNINNTTLPELADSELDNIISAEKQMAWLESPLSPIESFSRVQDEILRSKTIQRCEELLKDKNFKDYVLPVMRQYVRKCIPEPYLTELTFWGCSCLPPYNNSYIKIYSRINVRFQEVFTAFFDKKIKSECFSFHVCKSYLGEQAINKLYDEISTFDCGDHIYETGGYDQIWVGVASMEDALLLLQDKNFLMAAKKFNLARFKVGAQPWASYHSPALADYLLPI